MMFSRSWPRGERRRPGIEDELTRDAVSERAGLSKKRDLFHANIQIHITFCQRKAIWASAEVGRGNTWILPVHTA